MTDRYAVIGHPVGHSKSPWIHAQFARATGQDLHYEAIEAPRDGFVQAVEAFRAAGGKGLNVTLPFKGEAHDFCCGRLSSAALAARAVNTLLLDRDAPYGENTDGVGLVRDLVSHRGFAIRGRRVLIAGAGGAAQGVVQPLLEAGAARLVIANRNASRARELAARFPGASGGGYEALGGELFDLVINATSAGLTGEAPAIPREAFAPEALAYDMVYGRDTPFLEQARRAGVRACDGTGMLIEQAAESFFLWRGVRPDTGAVREALGAR